MALQNEILIRQAYGEEELGGYGGRSEEEKSSSL